jgi:hypothetical protein
LSTTKLNNPSEAAVSLYVREAPEGVAVRETWVTVTRAVCVIVISAEISVPGSDEVPAGTTPVWVGFGIVRYKVL